MFRIFFADFSIWPYLPHTGEHSSRQAVCLGIKINLRQLITHCGNRHYIIHVSSQGETAQEIQAVWLTLENCFYNFLSSWSGLEWGVSSLPSDENAWLSHLNLAIMAIFTAANVGMPKLCTCIARIVLNLSFWYQPLNEVKFLDSHRSLRESCWEVYACAYALVSVCVSQASKFINYSYN